MTKALIVRSSDDKRFLDRVLEHAVKSNALSLERRLFLASELSGVHPFFCARVGLNDMATAEAMLGARLIHNLTSLGLEIASGSDVALASEMLTWCNVLSLLETAEKRITAITLRIKKYAEAYVKTYEAVTPWGMNEVQLEYGRRPQTLAILWGIYEDLSQGLDVSTDVFLGTSAIVYKRRLYELIASLPALRQIEMFLDYIEKEFEVVRKYLPWDDLVREANLRYLKTGRLEIGGLKTSWGIASLLSTLAITMRLGGDKKNRPMVFWKDFRECIPLMDGLEAELLALDPQGIRAIMSRLRGERKVSKVRVKGFRNETLRLFEKYLNALVSPPSDEERQILFALMDWALGELTACMPEGKSRQQVLGWHDRIHIRVESLQTFRQIVYGMMDSEVAVTRGKKKRESPYNLDELSAIASVADKSVAGVMDDALSRFDWKCLKTEDEIRVLFDLASAEQIIKYMPLTGRLVAFLIKEGWELWSDANRHKVIESLIEKWTVAKWRKLSRELVDDLVKKATKRQVERISLSVGRDVTHDKKKIQRLRREYKKGDLI